MIRKSTISRALRIINENHAIISIGGEQRIVTKKPFKVISRNQLIKLYSHHALIWLAHKDRETYLLGVGVDPTGKKKGLLNLWQPIETKEGDCSILLEYILTMYCKDNEEKNKWLLDWLADMVQDPSNPKGRGVIIRDNVLIDIMTEIFIHNTNVHPFDTILVTGPTINPSIIKSKYIIAERENISPLISKNMIHPLHRTTALWGSLQKHVGEYLICTPQIGKEFKAFAKEPKVFAHYLMNRKITSKLTIIPTMRKP